MAVPRMNDLLRRRPYKEDAFWIDAVGEKVNVLWEEYTKSLREEEVKRIGVQQ